MAANTRSRAAAGGRASGRIFRQNAVTASRALDLARLRALSVARLTLCDKTHLYASEIAQCQSAIAKRSHDALTIATAPDLQPCAPCATAPRLRVRVTPWEHARARHTRKSGATA
jgi:hypothetical protein